MEIKCNICETPYTLRHDIYICEEGHIAPFSHESATVEENTYKGKGRKTQKVKSKRSKFNEIKIIIGKVYFKVKDKLKFDTDIPFKIYLSFIDCKSEDITFFKFKYLFCVFYYSLRIKYESEGKCLFFHDFIEIFKSCPYSEFMRNQLNEARVENISGINKIDLFGIYEINMYECECILRIFGELYFRKDLDKFYRITFNGDKILEAKKAFRSLVRRDQEIFYVYLEPILDKLCIKRSEDMYKLFSNYISIFNLDVFVFLPEVFICCFLYLFIRKGDNYKLIDIKRAVKNVCKYKDPFRDYCEYCKLKNGNEPINEIYNCNENCEDEPKYFMRKKFRNNLTNIFCIYLDFNYNRFERRVELCIDISDRYRCLKKRENYIKTKKTAYIKGIKFIEKRNIKKEEEKMLKRDEKIIEKLEKVKNTDLK